MKFIAWFSAMHDVVGSWPSQPSWSQDDRGALPVVWQQPQGCHRCVASSPGSSQFFNDARRKTREPGKIHHVRDVRWKGLGAAHAQFKNIARERSLIYLHFLPSWSVQACGDSSCLAQLFLHHASPSKCLILCMHPPRQAPSPFDLTSCTWWSLPGSLIFLRASLKNWEKPGYEAIHCTCPCIDIISLGRFLSGWHKRLG